MYAKLLLDLSFQLSIKSDILRELVCVVMPKYANYIFNMFS